MHCKREKRGEKGEKKIKVLSSHTSERLHKKESLVFKPLEFLTKEVVSPRSTSKESSILCHC